MSAPTVPQTISAEQANKEVPIQEDIRASCHQTTYAYRESTSSGLTFGYHGGRWGGLSVAAGTLALTGSATNYIVVLRSTGVPSVSTSSTNWNDSTSYARVYRVTTDGSGITNLYGADFDYRGGPGGAHGSVANSALAQWVAVACGDEATPITAGTAKVTFHWPFTGTVNEVWAGLTTPQASGSIFTVDVNDGASSILSTKVTIDNTEETSLTAAAQPVLSDTAVTKGNKATIDVDQVGDGTAVGLKVYISVTPS